MKKTRWLAIGTGLLLISFSWSVYPRLQPILFSDPDTSELLTDNDAEDSSFMDEATRSLYAEEAFGEELATSDQFSLSNKLALAECAYGDYQAAMDAARFYGEIGNELPLSSAENCTYVVSGSSSFSALQIAARRWSENRVFRLEEVTAGLADDSSYSSNPLVLLITAEDWSTHQVQYSLLAAQESIVVCYFGDELPLVLQEWGTPVFQFPNAGAIEQALAVEALFGAVAVQMIDGGFLPVVRMGQAPPEAVGIDREKLSDIEGMVERAIRRRAMPGCQVLVVKNQKIVYERAFGHFTYDKEEPVETDDLYDLASITKAAATTLAVMKLADEGHIDPAERLKAYLPDYRRSGTKYLRVRHLLSHHTGLQANMPIRKWLNDRSVFAAEPSEDYPNALSTDMYLRYDASSAFRDEIRRVRPGRARFRYGDVNFLLLQQVVEQQSGQTMDAYLNEQFYGPLGLQRTTFLPGLQFSTKEIAPTEFDRRWRGGLVHGVVHDEAAMLLGGVAGHAGLFSDARGLAILFQMLINEGQYGGHTYFSAETVRQFIQKNGYNYRAWGFDRFAGHSRALRRYGASNAIFGHTGFTGGCVWADPDNDLVFIFLSNRVHPNDDNDRLQRMGLRERIHRVIYRSLNTYSSGDEA